MFHKVITERTRQNARLFRALERLPDSDSDILRALDFQLRFKPFIMVGVRMGKILSPVEADIVMALNTQLGVI